MVQQPTHPTPTRARTEDVLPTRRTRWRGGSARTRNERVQRVFGAWRATVGGVCRASRPRLRGDAMERTLTDPPAETRRDTTVWTAASVYAAHADFVWASLSRLGVAYDDLGDQMQEVFLVVHRRLDSFDGSSRMTTWLFGICLHVVQAWRRHRRRHPETAVEIVPEPENHSPSPEDHAAERQARRTLDTILSRMDPEKRAVFVMFELEGLACVPIAEMLGVPVGTVYSRLHAARASFQQELARVRSARQEERR